MKSKKKLILLLANLFVIIASGVTSIGSFMLWGEPKCPKSLLK